MDTTTVFALVLAGMWGLIWSLFLQTYHGRFLAARMTWLAVVIGIGVDLAILLVAISFESWLKVFGVIAASSAAVIVRSLINEAHDNQALLRMKTSERARSQNTEADSE